MTPGRRSEDLRDEIEDLRVRVAALEGKPLNVGDVMFSAKSFLAACSIIAAIIGGSYLVNGSARSDVRDIKFMLDERTKTQDKTNVEMRGAIESLQRDIKATEERLRAEIRMKEYSKANGLRQP
jgi:hypothetical protein